LTILAGRILVSMHVPMHSLWRHTQASIQHGCVHRELGTSAQPIHLFTAGCASFETTSKVQGVVSSNHATTDDTLCLIVHHALQYIAHSQAACTVVAASLLATPQDTVHVRPSELTSSYVQSPAVLLFLLTAPLLTPPPPCYYYYYYENGPVDRPFRSRTKLTGHEP
jgi:hypothetical protein